MKVRTPKIALFNPAIFLMVLLMVFASAIWADDLPNAVQFKVDRCVKSLDEAEEELNARNPHMVREPLRVAREGINYIKQYQNASWEHPVVIALRARYDALDKRYVEASSKQEASAGLAAEQLAKLSKYRQFSSEATYPEHLVASQATYLAVKALVDEVLATGTDVQLSGDSDYKSAKLNVELWEEARERVIRAFIDTAKRYTQKNASREQDWLNMVDQRLVDVSKLLAADDPRIAEAASVTSAMKTFIRKEQLEQAAKVFMRQEKYKGKDANSLRALAKSAVSSKFPAAKVLKIKLISSKWGVPEGGTQWTDNTYSAIEVRTNSYFSCEVAAKHGIDVMLHRVNLYKARVNGQLQAAKSYVVGSQMMLEKNVK